MGKGIFIAFEEYEKDGVKKPDWKRLGDIFEGKNGKTYAKLYTIPGVLLHVFEDKKKDEF